MSKKKTHLRAQGNPPLVVYDVAALERARCESQIAKQRDARARSRERRLDRLLTVSTDPLVSFSKLHERPRHGDLVAYPLSSRFAAHLDRVRERAMRTKDRSRRVLCADATSLLGARQELRRRYPALSMAFEMTTFGGVSQSALAHMMRTTPSCISKRVARALFYLEQWTAA